MRLDSIYKIVYQTIILSSEEVHERFEEFLVYVMKEVDLATISKPNAKCMASTIIDAKLAKKFQFDYHDDFILETEEYKITFAFRESEQEKFVEKVNAFWAKKVMTTENA